MASKGGNMPEPKSTLKDVIEYLKSDEDCKGSETPLAEVKELSDADRLDLRVSLDKVRGL
jgi:hypothetical protein